METNKIYNGDCFELFKQLEDNSVDYVFTSPPYNRLRNDKYQYYTDQISDYFKMLCDVVDQSLRVAKKHLFLNIQATMYNCEDVYGLFGQYKHQIKQVFIWEKLNPMPSNGFSITNAFEYIICIGEESLKAKNTYTKNVIQTSVNSDMPEEHKAVMHPFVADWFIYNFTQEKSIVLDPIMGTGTTAVSCAKYGREYICFEKSEQYCRMARERIERETSQLSMV